MTHVTKMLLVPQDVLRNNSSSDLGELDKQMYDILYESNLTDEIKWKLYSQCLQKYLHRVSENARPLEVPIIEKGEALTATAPSEIDLNLFSLMQKVPNTVKGKAAMLYEYLKNGDKIKWTKNGSVAIDNSIIPESNIVDLICNGVQGKNSKPKGWAEFANSILDLNTPKQYLGKSITALQTVSTNNEASTSQQTTPRLTRPPSSRTRKKKNTYSPHAWKKFKF